MEIIVVINKVSINKKLQCTQENGSIQCANVCFFNSLIQVLISIPNYHDNILQTLQVDNPAVTNLRDLFKEIDKSNDCVDTFR